MTGRQNGSFRASAHTGVGIPIEFQATYRHTVCSNLPFSGAYSRKVVRLTGRLPHQSADWFAMTDNRQIPIYRAAEKTDKRIILYPISYISNYPEGISELSIKFLPQWANKHRVFPSACLQSRIVHAIISIYHIAVCPGPGSPRRRREDGHSKIRRYLYDK